MRGAVRVALPEFIQRASLLLAYRGRRRGREGPSRPAGIPCSSSRRGAAVEGHDLGAIFDAVTASAAFPGAFRPVGIDVDGREPVACLDGGLVNNAPIKHAIDDNDVDRVFIVTPSPALAYPEPADGHGVGLLAHLVEILVSERLYRDLREART